MSLQGMVDLQHFVQSDLQEVRAYYGFESPDVYVLPNAIGLAKSANEKPDFNLTLVKTHHPMSPVSLYGTIDLGLELRHPLQAAQEAIRETGHVTKVVPVFCEGGFLQLQALNAEFELAPGLRAPFEANWNLVGPTRFSFRLSASSATLMKQALLEGSFLFRATVMLTFTAMAVRLPLVVQFDPKDLIQHLVQKLGSADGKIREKDIQDYILSNENLLRIATIGSRSQELPGQFAQAMTDRLLARFAKLELAITDDDDCQYTLPADIAERSIEWDLSKMLPVEKVLFLDLNPIQAAKEVAGQAGGALSSIRETLIPPLQTGFKCLNVAANLASYRPNALRTGVRITADANPPVRMQAISETVNFAGSDSADIVLRFSPAEAAEFQLQPFMVIRDVAGVHEIRGDLIMAESERILCNTAHFRVQPIVIEAAADLLEMATLSVWLMGSRDGPGITYELSSAHPILTVYFEESAVLPDMMRITATTRADGQQITLPDEPCKSMRIGRYHFKEYGFHPLRICYQFTGEENDVVIELVPEIATAETVPFLMFFTKNTPCQEWSYFADSPFEAGYRYRFRKNENEFSEWSDVQNPFTPLHLAAVLS